MLFDLSPRGPVFQCVGLSRDDAKEVLDAWGEPEPFRRQGQPADGWMVRLRTGAIFAYCDEAGRVEAVEFASPGHGTPSEDHVLFDGVDLFIEPALAVVRRLRSAGLEIIEEEGGYSYIAPGVLLALWRDGEPRDATGMPLFFESALIADAGYYESDP